MLPPRSCLQLYESSTQRLTYQLCLYIVKIRGCLSPDPSCVYDSCLEKCLLILCFLTRWKCIMSRCPRLFVPTGASFSSSNLGDILVLSVPPVISMFLHVCPPPRFWHVGVSVWFVTFLQCCVPRCIGTGERASVADQMCRR